MPDSTLGQIIDQHGFVVQAIPVYNAWGMFDFLFCALLLD